MNDAGRLMTGRLLRGAAGFLFWIDGRFYRGLAGPVGLLVLAWLVEQGMSRLAPEYFLIQLLLMLVLLALFLASTTLLATMVHRCVLLGTSDDFGWGLFWSPRETRFAMRMIGLIVIALPALPFAMLPVLGPVIAPLVASYLIARCSLVFPAIAVGRPMGYRQSWRATESVQGPLIVALVIVPLLIYLPFGWLQLPGWLMPLSLLVDLMITLYLTAILSLLHRELVDLDRSSEP